MSDEGLQKDILETFQALESGPSDELTQKLASFSYQLSCLQPIEELIPICADSTFQLHMCFLVLRDILIHRGFLLPIDILLHHYKFLIDCGIDNMEIIMQESFLSCRNAQCIAVLFRLIIENSDVDEFENPFSIIKEKMESGGDALIFGFILLNELIESFGETLPFETESDFNDNIKYFVREYFDEFFRICVSNISSYPEYPFKVMKSIFSFPVDWIKNNTLFVNICTDLDKITDIFLQFISENQELSDTVAFCFAEILRKMKGNLRNNKRAYSEKIINIITTLCLSANETNCVSISSCIYNCIDLYQERVSQKDGLECQQNLLQFTENAVFDPECILNLIKTWALISKASFEIIKQHNDSLTKSKKRNYSSSSDEEEKDHSSEPSYYEILEQNVSKAFLLIIDWLLSLDDTNFDSFIIDGGEFIDNYKSLWEICGMNLEQLSDVICERCDNITSIHQIIVLSLMSCCLLKSNSSNFLFNSYIECCSKVLDKILDVIEAFSPEECQNIDDLILMCDNLSYFSIFMIDNIIRKTAQSKSIINSIIALIQKNKDYDISIRIYHVLLNMYLRSLHVFQDPQAIYQCILCIQNFISNSKTNLDELMKNNELLQDHVTFSVGLDLGNIKFDDQIFLLRNYYKTISRPMSHNLIAFLNSVHDELMEIDVTSPEQCIFLTEKLHGTLKGVTDSSAETCVDFLNSEDHMKKFVEIINSQNENPTVFESVLTLYSYANEAFYRNIYSKESGIVFVHRIFEFLNVVKEFPYSNEKMSSSTKLIENALKYRTAHFYGMRYFKDDLLSQFVDTLFQILINWPKEDIESNINYLLSILSALHQTAFLDKDLLRIEGRPFITLSFVQSGLLYRGDGYEEVWKESVNVLQEIIEFSDGTLGPLTAPFVIIIEDIMNDPLLTPKMINLFCAPIKAMRSVAEEDIFKITSIAIESYDQQYKENVSKIFQSLWNATPDTFDSEWKKFASAIRRYQVMFSTLSQFIEIFRQTSE